MKVTRIKLHNVMGIEDISIETGKVTLVSGKNATGKTSIMSGICSIIKGGHDAQLLRVGESEGEAVIVFDDGTELSKKITADKSNTSVSLDGITISSPASYIKELFGTGFNPVSFLTMSEKDRVSEILKALPVSLSAEKLTEIAGDFLSQIDAKEHPLKIIDKLHKLIYDERTGYNRLVTDSEKTIDTLKKSLVVIDDDVSDQINELNEAIATSQSNVTKESNFTAEKISRIREDMETELQAVRDKYAVMIETERETLNAVINILTESETKARISLSSLNEKADLAKMQEGTKKQIAELNAKTETNAKTAVMLGMMLDRLDKTKRSLTDGVELLGKKVSIDSGMLFFDGIQYDKLNTAEKVRIAIALATMNVGKAKFAVVDGAECLDAETLDLLAKEASASGIQLLLFSVSNDNKLSSSELV